MKDQLITFETSKLAKGKGFKEGSKKGYLPDGKLSISQYASLCYNDEEDYPTKYAAPTQSLLQKWLREVHNIYVEISFNQKYENTRFGYIVRTQSTCFHTRDFSYKTYEEALEAGLQEALKLIK